MASIVRLNDYPDAVKMFLREEKPLNEMQADCQIALADLIVEGK
ncbi:MAG: hypothetical protein NTX14_00365 [Candidatus Nealsonbacteria bacterium]|nr:hypothetical protein [Candidatus Nealsonbacteria bacterium]